MGFNTMRNGMHSYFEKYQWGNTTLPDFVGSLDAVYQESGDTCLGENGMTLT